MLLKKKSKVLISIIIHLLIVTNRKIYKAPSRIYSKMTTIKNIDETKQGNEIKPKIARLRNAIYSAYNLKPTFKHLYTGSPIADREKVARVVQENQAFLQELEREGYFVGYWPEEGSLCVARKVQEFPIPNQDRECIMIRTQDQDFDGIETYYAKQTRDEYAKLLGKNSIVNLDALGRLAETCLYALEKYEKLPKEHHSFEPGTKESVRNWDDESLRLELCTHMLYRGHKSVYDRIVRLLRTKQLQGERKKVLLNAFQEFLINYFTRIGHRAELADEEEALRSYLDEVKRKSPEAFLVFADTYTPFPGLKPRHADAFKQFWQNRGFDERKLITSPIEVIASTI